MQIQDRILIMLFNSTINNVPDSEGKDSGRGLRFIVFILCFFLVLLLLVGNETVKIIFRKKMGAGELSMFRISLSLFAYVGIALIYFNYSDSLSQIEFFDLYSVNTFSIFAAGVFYLVLALLVFLLGSFYKGKADRSALPNYYPGISKFFNWKNKAMVRNLIEPGSFLLVGVSIGFINPFWGVPIFICSISYWLTLLIEYITGIEDERVKVQDVSIETNNNTDFSTVVS